MSATMSDSDGQDGSWEDWSAEEDASDLTKSLFDGHQLPSSEAALQHDAQHHKFDLRQFRLQAGLDSYEMIRCINYIRSEVAVGKPAEPIIAELASSSTWRSDDKLLQPVLLEDGLLCHDFSDDEEGQGAAAGPSETKGKGPAEAGLLQAMAQENEELRQALSELSQMTVDAGMQDSHPPPLQGRRENPGATQRRARDESYFESYGSLGIHREMLADKVRTEAYRDALERNPGLLNGARVLDVGCGTGILSMFAARAGARHVIGVDGSPEIAKLATSITSANAGLLEGSEGSSAAPHTSVSIVCGQIEQIDALPEEQVDVLVSEWMGYALLFESMLDSVLFARDRWLKPGGAILPDTATISVAAASRAALDISFWDSVYGFSYKPVQAEMLEHAFTHAGVHHVPGSSILSEPMVVHHLDLATMRPDDAYFTTPFKLVPKQAADEEQECCALVIWFDTSFTERFCQQHPVRLPTSPHDTQTHWAQTVLTLRKPVCLDTGLSGYISMGRSQSHRGLDISLTLGTDTQLFSME